MPVLETIFEMKSITILTIIILTTLLCGCKKDNESNQKESITVTLSIVDLTIFNMVETEFSVTASSEIKEARFYFDGKSIGSVITTPYKLKYTPINIDPGQHEIKCIVVSLNGNEFSAAKNANLILRLGDEYKGGKIFYLDQSGVHGLISSTKDLDIVSGIGFHWGEQQLINTTKDNGFENTKKMISVSPNEYYAAYHFKNGYNYNGYNDWYIPAIQELEILKENMNLVGGFTNDLNWKANYWSSSELSASNAEALHFNVLMGNSYNKQSYGLMVRPIRKF